MSSARDRREAVSEERRAQRRESLENLLDEYKDIFKEISGVIVARITSDEDESEECECNDCCGECSCGSYNPIEERVNERALDSIREIVNRWSEDPDYNSEDAMDHVCNVIEKMGR